MKETWYKIIKDEKYCADIRRHFDVFEADE